MDFLTALVFLLAVVAIALLVWRLAGWACPAWLVPLLENRYVESVAGAPLVLERAGVRAGMRVLDAGCGPGRLTLPAARVVGAAGTVTAIDMQPAMLDKLRRRLADADVNNVEPRLGALGGGELPEATFDVAFLVTVLGEIADQEAALRELYTALKPGGTLSITEVLPDPHYQRVARVRSLVSAAGFREVAYFPGRVAFTINFER